MSTLEHQLGRIADVLEALLKQGDQLLAQRGTVAPVTAAATVEPVAKETAASAKTDKKPKPKAEPVKEPEAPKLEVVEPEEEEEEENLDDLDPAEESEVTEEDIRQWRRDEGATTKDLAALKKIFADTIAAHGGVLDGKPNLPAVPKAKLPALLAALKAAVA